MTIHAGEKHSAADLEKAEKWPSPSGFCVRCGKPYADINQHRKSDERKKNTPNQALATPEHTWARQDGNAALANIRKSLEDLPSVHAEEMQILLPTNASLPSSKREVEAVRQVVEHFNYLAREGEQNGDGGLITKVAQMVQLFNVDISLIPKQARHIAEDSQGEEPTGNMSKQAMTMHIRSTAARWLSGTGPRYILSLIRAQAKRLKANPALAKKLEDSLLEEHPEEDEQADRERSGNASGNTADQGQEAEEATAPASGPERTQEIEEKKSVIKAQLAVSSGALSKAVQQLESHGVAPRTAEVRDQMRELIPKADETEKAAWEECLIEVDKYLEEVYPPGFAGVRLFDQDTLKGVMDNLGTYSAAGHSGERVAGLKLLGKAGIMPSLWVVMDTFQKGRATNDLLLLLRTGRLLPLYKDEKKSALRPVTIPSLWGRVLEKCVVAKVTKDAGDMMGRQLAVGSHAAAEQANAAILAAIHMHPGSVLVKMDYANGYGTIRRSTVMRELLRRKNAAGLLFMRQWYRTTPKVMFCFQDGTVEYIEVERGLDQGGACSPYLFSIVADQVLKKLDQQEGVHLALGLLDDLFCVTSPDKASQMVDGKLVDKILAEEETGMAVKESKTAVFDPYSETRKETTMELKIQQPNVVVTAGVEVLGVPIATRGTPGSVWLRKYLEAKIASLKQLLAKIELLEPQHALALLRHCAASRVAHLWRTVPIEMAMHPARMAEKEIWASVMRILGAPETEEKLKEFDFNVERGKKLCFLPIAMSGLGVISPVRSLEPAFVGGWMAGLAELKLGNPTLYEWWIDRLKKPSTSQMDPVGVERVCKGLNAALNHIGKKVGGLLKNPLEAPIPVSVEDLSKLPTSMESMLLAVEAGRGAKMQKALYSKMCMSDWIDLAGRLSLESLALVRARTSPGSQSHLTTLPGHKWLYMKPGPVRCMMRYTLLLPLGNVSIPLGVLENKEGTPDNFDRCMRLLRTGHHSEMHTDFILKAEQFLESVEIPVLHEPQFGVDDKNVARRGDLAEHRLASDTSRVTTGYDGTLVSPSAIVCVKQAAKQAGKAAEIAEAKKEKANTGLCAKKGWRFAALVAEETGHFGVGLKKFIKKRFRSVLSCTLPPSPWSRPGPLPPVRLS